MSDADRDHDWVNPDDTQADIIDHLERLARGDELDVDVPTGRLTIQRDGNEWVAEHYGLGGGWCWRERWDRRDARLYLTQWDDTDDKEIAVRYRPK